MHHPALALTALIALALAAPAPAPQDIEFDLVYALPNPSSSVDLTATVQVVKYDPTSVIQNAIPQITQDVHAEGPGSTLKKRLACQKQPAGAKNAPAVADDAGSFKASVDFSNVANGAVTPSGYTQTFKNLNASNNAYGYMGYSTLDSYDVTTCAGRCTKVNGCMSFNIYFERLPSVEPADSCPNPTSVTAIKCVYWGGPVTAENANNYGQWRNKFQVVIAGSNGYQNNSIVTPPGYNTPVFLNNAAINAPYDSFGFDSYMGVALFNSGPFDIKLCADACNLKSKYNLEHPPTDGTPVTTCQFFNTYILYINESSNAQGQYCAMYSQTWSDKYAVNKGQTRGYDRFLILNSYSVSNKMNPGAACKDCAVRQMSKDVSWHTLQPYCSTLLGYDKPAATKIVYNGVTATITETKTVSSNVPGAPVLRRDATPTAVPINNKVWPIAISAQTTPAVKKRQAAKTPDVLTKYPLPVQTSACSLQATPWTTTVSSETTVATVTLTQSTVVNVTPTGFRVKAVAPPAASGLYIKYAGSDPNNMLDAYSLNGQQSDAFIYHFDATDKYGVVSNTNGKKAVVGLDNLYGATAFQSRAETGEDTEFATCKRSAEGIFTCRGSTSALSVWVACKPGSGNPLLFLFNPTFDDAVALLCGGSADDGYILTLAVEDVY
ncbi:hypothetical protein BDZ85DRAFT_315612 [Elsinoe ampelina]|uniref:Apple domain-containing protein n=1 Tax=Elsinoe ampelina TaxID=302913 RepID=A0A6A6GQU0_9PEZI|nr:hypothetical protein BDZ85DRAFT_315612 [Elsinoe ampelina]